MVKLKNKCKKLGSKTKIGTCNIVGGVLSMFWGIISYLCSIKFFQVEIRVMD